MLERKNIIVIGGAGLIGSAIVKSILNKNVNVVLADINLEQAKKVKLEIDKNLKSRIIIEKINVNNHSSIKRLIDKIDTKFGVIDTVVNSIYPKNKTYGKNFKELSLNEFNQNVTTHLGPYFLIMQQFCKYFEKKNKGCLINISSIYGSLVPRFEIYQNTNLDIPVDYVASKSAIIQLTKYFAQFYKKNNIRVNSISPGGIFDNQNETFIKAYKKFSGNKGMLSPGDISNAVNFLISDQSKFINGQNLIVDDGFSL